MIACIPAMPTSTGGPSGFGATPKMALVSMTLCLSARGGDSFLALASEALALSAGPVASPAVEFWDIA
jgi:hypothetical protein